MTKSSVLVVGMGGVGTIAALGLELGGRAQVSAVVRSDYDIITTKGYQIDSLDHGKFENWRPSYVFKSIDEAAAGGNGDYDFVIVCTKVLPDLFSVEELIEPVVSANTVIVMIQNGIDIEAPVVKKYPKNIVLSGVSMIGSQNFHGKILQNEHDQLKLGYCDSVTFYKSECRKAAVHFADIYKASGVKCTYVDDLQRARWMKLVYNSCINTACAAIQLDAGRMFLCGGDKSLILPAMAEIKKIANAVLGEPLPDDIDIQMLMSDDGVYYKPSMQVDIEKGNPIELEAILGNPLRIAKQHGIETPILTVLYYVLKGVQFRLMENRGHVKCPPEGPSRKTHEPMWEYPYF